MRRRPIAILALLLATGLASCGPRAQTVILNGDAPDQSRVGALEFRGGLELDLDADGFGGLSALDVSDDGRDLVAMSDAGRWFSIALRYDDRDWLSAAQLSDTGLLVSPNGRAPARKGDADAESMLRLADGSFVVGFEIDHRLLRYPVATPPFSAPPTRLVAPPGIAGAVGNNGMEALTRLADGRLLVIAEDMRRADVTGAWIGDGESWDRTDYVLTPPFRPTGAALLPDGDVVVVERRASVLGGLGARLVRLGAADIAKGGPLRGAEIARLEPPVTVDNFEGVAVRTTADGETLLYLVSDNNFSLFQRTLLLMFALRS